MKSAGFATIAEQLCEQRGLRLQGEKKTMNDSFFQQIEKAERLCEILMPYSLFNTEQTMEDVQLLKERVRSGQDTVSENYLSVMNALVIQLSEILEEQGVMV